MVYLNTNLTAQAPKATVIGIGRLGCLVVNKIHQENKLNIQYLAISSIFNHYNLSLPNHIKLDMGLGLDWMPDYAIIQMQSKESELYQLLNNTNLVIIISDMECDVSWGGSLALAEIIKKINIDAIAILTKPANFTGKMFLAQANKYIDNFTQLVPSTMVIPSQLLVRNLNSFSKFIDDRVNFVSGIIYNYIATQNSYLFK